MKKILSCLLALCLLLPCAVSACADGAYQTGDKPEDFCITTSTGEEVSLYGLLETYEAVVLNFWFAGCQPCAMEFPYMQEAYDEYADSIYLLCITPADDSAEIEEYKEQRGLHLNMAADLAMDIDPHYVEEGYPTTVVIDRFGVICWKECGCMPDAARFANLFEGFVGEDYTESKVNFEIPDNLPDIGWDDTEKFSAACAEGTEVKWQHEDSTEIWPWALAEDGESIHPTNAGQNLTNAAVSLTVEGKSGECFCFDYRISSQLCEDALRVTVDGELQAYISGEKDWQTREIRLSSDGEHSITFSYCKNWALEAGEDTVYIRNISVRPAAEGENAARPQADGLGKDEYRLIPVSEMREVYLLADGKKLDIMPLYLTEEDEPTFKVLLGEDVLPELCFVAPDFENYLAVEDMESDEEGYLFTLASLSALPTGEFGYAELFPALSGMYSESQQAAIVLESEDRLEFLLYAVVAGDASGNYSWCYADEYTE